MNQLSFSFNTLQIKLRGDFEGYKKNFQVGSSLIFFLCSCVRGIHPLGSFPPEFSLTEKCSCCFSRVNPIPWLLLDQHLQGGKVNVGSEARPTCWGLKPRLFHFTSLNRLFHWSQPQFLCLLNRNNACLPYSIAASLICVKIKITGMEYVLFCIAKCQFKPVVLAQSLTMPSFTQKVS